MSEKVDTERTMRAEAGTERTNLDRQYRDIGISAVAAALPFVGKMKNPAKVPARVQDSHATRRKSVLAV